MRNKGNNAIFMICYYYYYCLLLILTERNVVVSERDWLKKIPVDIQFNTYDVFPE